MQSLREQTIRAKERLSSYFTPPPPPQQDSLGSGFIGLIDYITYEGADLSDLAEDIAIIIADAVAANTGSVEPALHEGNIVLTDHKKIHLNVTARVLEEWEKKSPSAEELAERLKGEIELHLNRQQD